VSSVDKDKLTAEPAAETTASESGAQVRAVIDEAGENRFILAGVVDAYLAEELHRRALELLESGRDIALDLSEVDSMDVCTMQILLALRGDMAALGKKLVVSAESANAALSFRMAGIDGMFMAA
jgi:anti-anti-sigma factor